MGAKLTESYLLYRLVKMPFGRGKVEEFYFLRLGEWPDFIAIVLVFELPIKRFEQPTLFRTSTLLGT